MSFRLKTFKKKNFLPKTSPTPPKQKKAKKSTNTYIHTVLKIPKYSTRSISWLSRISKSSNIKIHIILDSFKMVKDTVPESWFTWTTDYTRENFILIRKRARAMSFFPMRPFIRAPSLMASRMAKAPINGPMARFTMESGFKE